MAAATGTRQYTAIFAIGAKMLASFRGVMNAASARLTKLRTQTLAFGKSILKLTGIIGLLGTAVAGLGIGELLRSLFTGATDQAKEARQRINSTIASFLQLRDIAKAGDPWKKAQDQLDIIYKQNEALGKQGVLHTDIYNEMTKQLAAGGVPPRQIKAALGPLGDLLVKTRGVNASEAEAAELAMQYVKAIHGKTKGMQAFGVFIDANKIDSQGRKVKKSYQEIFEQVLKIMSAKGIAGFNERMAATPEGKIQILRNRLQDMREEIGNRILPAQARMAEMWLKILTPENQKLLFNAVDWFMNKLSDLVDYLKNEVIPWFKSDEGRKFFKQLGDAAVWVVKNWKPLAKTIIGVVVALYALQAVTTAINFVSVLVNPVGLVVAALVILAAVIYLLITHWREFVDGVDAAYKKLGEIPIIGPALQIMMLPFKQLVHLIDWLINVDWGAVGKVISDTWNDTWEKVKHIWETAKKAIADSWAWLKKGFVKLGQSILEALLDPINKVIDGVNTMIDAVNKINPFAKIPNVPRIAFGGAGGAAGGAQAAAAVTAPAQTAAHQIPLTPEGLKSVQEERASIMQDMRRPELRNLISATLATEASGAEDQKNVLESLTNRLVSQKMAGTYKGVEDYIKNSGFYGPYKRGETQAVMAKGLSDARYKQVGDFIEQIAQGRNALGGLTDQGLANEIHGAIKEQHGEDYYGLMGMRGEKETAAYRYSRGAQRAAQAAQPQQDAAQAALPEAPPYLRGYQEGGLARTPQLATLAEKGPEIVMPMGRLAGLGGHHIEFSPNITINGNASEAEQSALEAKLRNVAREFIDNFKRAQYQERRLSYESGYG